MVGIFKGVEKVNMAAPVAAVYVGAEKVWPTFVPSFSGASLSGALNQFTQEIMVDQKGWQVGASDVLLTNEFQWIPPNSFSPIFHWVTEVGKTYFFSITLTKQTSTLGYVSARIYHDAENGGAFVSEGARADVPGTSELSFAGDGTGYNFMFGWEANLDRDSKWTDAFTFYATGGALVLRYDFPNLVTRWIPFTTGSVSLNSNYTRIVSGVKFSGDTLIPVEEGKTYGVEVSTGTGGGTTRTLSVGTAIDSGEVASRTLSLNTAGNAQRLVFIAPMTGNLFMTVTMGSTTSLYLGLVEVYEGG